MERFLLNFLPDIEYIYLPIVLHYATCYCALHPNKHSEIIIELCCLIKVKCFDIRHLSSVVVKLSDGIMYLLKNIPT